MSKIACMKPHADRLAQMAMHATDTPARRATLARLAEHAATNLPGTTALLATDVGAPPSPARYIIDQASGLTLGGKAWLVALATLVLGSLTGVLFFMASGWETGVGLVDALPRILSSRGVDPAYHLVWGTAQLFITAGLACKLCFHVGMILEHRELLRLEPDTAYAVDHTALHVLRVRRGLVQVASYPADHVVRTVSNRGDVAYRIIEERGAGGVKWQALPFLGAVPSLDALVERGIVQGPASSGLAAQPA